MAKAKRNPHESMPNKMIETIFTINFLVKNLR